MLNAARISCRATLDVLEGLGCLFASMMALTLPIMAAA